jgi:F-type H+-transporting ATPase subunit beta
MLDPATVGQEHVDVATGVRQLLERASKRSGDTVATRRAAQLQRFLTQPFFVAEPFTNLPGVSVPRDAAIRGCAAILQGRHDDLAEEVLYMAGTLDDALART